MTAKTLRFMLRGGFYVKNSIKSNRIFNQINQTTCHEKNTFTPVIIRYCRHVR